MKIKEIEELTGMERANIRFYEREGLITPKRMQNGYRDYSDHEVQMLLRIKLLRSLHVSLDEIKALKDGNKSLADILSYQIAKLEQEKQDASYAQNVCRAIQEDKVTFFNLDAKKYLDDINRTMKERSSLYFTVKGDDLPQVYHPWRRYLARMLDIFIYSIIWWAFLAFVFHSNIATRSNIENLLHSFIVLTIMLFVEPLWLHLFGTTPGKAIFGLRIENPDGSNISYSEGLQRTWGVIGYGMGYNLPVYSTIRIWKSYKLCSDNEIQPWDEHISYTIKDTKKYRSVLYIGACVALCAVLITIFFAQQLPPNRGNLTIAEFVENHNYYAKYHGIDLGNEYLNKDGEWVKKAEKEGGGTFHYEIGYAEKPEYHFAVKNGYVTGVSFTIETKNNDDWINSYNKHMILASLAFAGAQDKMRLFSNIPNRISEQIENNTFKDFQFDEAGITFACDVEYSGYEDWNLEYLFPEEYVEETYFKLVFSMNK